MDFKDDKQAEFIGRVSETVSSMPDADQTFIIGLGKLIDDAIHDGASSRAVVGGLLAALAAIKAASVEANA